MTQKEMRQRLQDKQDDLDLEEYDKLYDHYLRFERSMELEKEKEERVWDPQFCSECRNVERDLKKAEEQAEKDRKSKERVDARKAREEVSWYGLPRCI